MKTITCNKCNKSKASSNFKCIDVNRQYFRHTCNDCRNLDYVKYYELKKETIISNRMKRYYLNPEKEKDEMRVSHQKFKSKRNNAKKQYYINNKEKIDKYVFLYWNDPVNYKRKLDNLKNRYKTDVQFKLTKLIRGRLSKSINEKKPSSSIKELGCNVFQLKLYLESKFLPEMTWENHGKWHIDHIRPLCSFNLSNLDEFKIACHYTNLQPLWAKDNLAKGGKY